MYKRPGYFFLTCLSTYSKLVPAFPSSSCFFPWQLPRNDDRKSILSPGKNEIQPPPPPPSHGLFLFWQLMLAGWRRRRKEEIWGEKKKKGKGNARKWGSASASASATESGNESKKLRARPHPQTLLLFFAAIFRETVLSTGV